MPTIANKRLIDICNGSILLLLALLIRLTVLEGTIIEHPIRADAQDYFHYAYNLKAYNTYSKQRYGEYTKAPKADAIRPPGLAFFAAIFISDYPSEEEVRQTLFFQTLLSCLCVVLVYAIGIGFMPRSYAFLAAFLTAISPHLSSANTYLLTESLFSSLLIIGIFLIGLSTKKHDDRTRFILLCLAGLAIGYAVLVRSSLQYFVPVIIVLMWLYNRRQGLAIKLGFAFFALAPMCLWMLRNYLVTGETSDPTLLMSALHHGIYPDFMYNNDPESYGIPYRFDPELSRISPRDLSSVFYLLFERASEAPSTYLNWYLIGKPMMFWSWDIVAGMGDVFVYPASASPYWSNPLLQSSHQLTKLLHTPLVLVAAPGVIILAFKYLRRPLTNGIALEVQCIGCLLLYMTTMHILVAPYPRYSVPLRPELYLAACYCVFILTTQINKLYVKRRSTNAQL